MRLFIILLLLITAPFALAQSTKISVKILEILDGDTIIAQINKNSFSIRLTGIDCYEISKSHRAYHQAYDNNLKIDEVIKKGNFSKHYLSKLYKNSKNVYFEFEGIDKYGRALGKVYFDDTDINTTLKTVGGCMPF